MLEDEFFLGTKLYHKKLMELCYPIIAYLGVTHVIFVNIDKQGRAFAICTHPNWVERFLEEKYYNLDPLMVHPNNIHNGFSFDSSIQEQEFKDVLLYDAVVNFDWCNSFAYVEKNPLGGYVGIDFGTTKENYKIFNELLNSPRIVKNLIRDLMRKINILINKDLKENTINFASLKGELFTKQQGLVFHPQNRYQNKINLLIETGILNCNDEPELLTKVELSPQEINCLRSYITSRSIKKVSGELNLALSTITSYIENIKIKLNCNNKNDLFYKAEVLEVLGRI